MISSLEQRLDKFLGWPIVNKGRLFLRAFAAVGVLLGYRDQKSLGFEYSRSSAGFLRRFQCLTIGHRYYGADY